MNNNHNYRVRLIELERESETKAEDARVRRIYQNRILLACALLMVAMLLAVAT